MFKVEFYVDDNRLGEVFKRLVGIGRNIQHAYVPNVEAKADGRLHMTAEESFDLLAKEMHRRKLTELTAKPAQEIMAAIGLSPRSYSYLLNNAVQHGFMTKRKINPKGNAMVYALKAVK
jgi:hypothetical protein